jgi:hypothetical protein
MPPVVAQAATATTMQEKRRKYTGKHYYLWSLLM